jgi:erythromycin esterase-like protein
MRRALEALAGFERFPTWMWRNADVLDFVGWLRAYNDAPAPDVPKTGFYGLDLYSLYASMEAVVNYLEKVDPDAARRARYRYSCFEHFGEQNARLVKNAEEYYRTMFRGRVSSWNLRDRHMAETLEALTVHLGQKQGAAAKMVVWEHNSHVGDARATEMGQAGELNVGQLVRQRHDREAVLVGFSTYSGTVTAASDWGGPAERKRVRPALPESYEAMLHNTGLPSFLLTLRGDREAAEELREPRLERAIGVIYRPDTERRSHYFHARLADQFDAVIHFDETRAVEPLERTAKWETGEVWETFPSGV